MSFVYIGTFCVAAGVCGRCGSGLPAIRGGSGAASIDIYSGIRECCGAACAAVILLKSSRRILLVYGTMAVAEDAVFLTEDFGMELDIGRLQPLLKTGTFEVSLDNPSTGPRLYALNLNGSREKELPVAYRNGKLLINVDTSRLEYGTPFFELSFDGRPRPEN